MAELDFTDLAPDAAPDRELVNRAITDADLVSVAGPVPALGAVLTALLGRDRLGIGVIWIPAADPMSAGLSRAWGVDRAGRLTGESTRQLGLVRDDRGGVLLARGRISPFGSASPNETAAQRRSRSRFGAQIYHDDQQVADGAIQRIDVRPDWSAADTLKVNVHKQMWRRGNITLGRAIQVACDEARIEVDGVALPRPMTKWTWYADHRMRWNLVSV